MESDRREFFKTLLDERLQSLLQAAGSNIEKLTTEQDVPADTIDIASLESNRDFTLRLADRERRLVGKIRSALKRVQEDEYGCCVNCGGDISERRLLARPVATHCIDCKTEAEQLENRGRRW